MQHDMRIGAKLLLSYLPDSRGLGDEGFCTGVDGWTYADASLYVREVSGGSGERHGLVLGKREGAEGGGGCIHCILLIFLGHSCSASWTCSWFKLDGLMIA